MCPLHFLSTMWIYLCHSTDPIPQTMPTSMITVLVRPLDCAFTMCQILCKHFTNMTSVQTTKIYQYSIWQLVTLSPERLDTTWKAMQLGKHLDPDSLAQGHKVLFAYLPPSIVSDFLEGKDTSFISISLWPSSVFGTSWVLNESLWNESFTLSSNSAHSFQMGTVYDKDCLLDQSLVRLLWSLFSTLGFSVHLPIAQF